MCGQPNLKKTKTEKKRKKKKVKVSQIGQSDSHRVTVPHQKKKCRVSFISFISFFIQSFSEIKRERERERD